jgi:4-hydroxybenzoate polyprenyltransferase
MWQALKYILISMRPNQWVKNLFVMAPLIFSKNLLIGREIIYSLLAFVVFCLFSGAVYLFNDSIDIEKDKLHPKKRERPIPSGMLKVRDARIAVVVLFFLALAGSAAISFPFMIVAAGYFVFNVIYSLYSKNVVYADVASIALGFILRVYAGCLAILVVVSPWLFICTFLLALFLGFGKRRHEVRLLADANHNTRAVLSLYKGTHLRIAFIATGALTIVAYFLYTISSLTIHYFGTYRLIFTVPFIIFGIFRFYRVVEKTEDVQNPTDAIIKDPLFIVNFLGWCVVAILIIYKMV